MRLVPPAVSLLALCALATPFAPAASLGFAPSGGTSLEKTFTTEIALELDRFEFLVNGEDATQGEDPAGDGTYVSKLVVRDTYEEVEEGRPTNFVRRYDLIENEESGNLPLGGDDDGPLQEVEGLSVRFRWDAQAEEYERSYDGEDDGDGDALEELEADLDLLVLLPRGEVEVGDVWSIPASRLESLLSPGEDISARMDGEGSEDLPQELVETLKASFADLEVICTFDQIVEQDGARLALISLDLGFDDTVDLVDSILGMLDMQEDMPEGMEVAVEVADASFDCQGDGILTWNLDSGHVAALTFSTALEIDVDLAASLEMQGQPMADIEVSGAATVTLEREVEVQ